MKNFSYKYRIYPNKEQQEKIWVNINGARYVYNALLADAKEQYESTGKSKIKNVTFLYEDTKNLFLKDCDSIALSYARRHLDTAYKNFFRGIKKHKKVGFPKFKSYYKDSWSYTTKKDTKRNNIKVADGKIKLPKI
ncbi:helix-turn-helix domain-containing protein, partial [Staphylococcus aureus]|uniref:helix-turn-helix domain-containing protein n=1 Tax=Staphylococcus aureus TaxID=1280 RepID=UPI001CF2A1EE